MTFAFLSAPAMAALPPASDANAIPYYSPLFVAWANGNLPVQYGTEVDDIWKTPAKAYGIAKESDPYDIVCLGNGGKITMTFPHPIRDGAGADFAVFENGFSNTFLELAYVEVSSDGVNFSRFPSVSLTPSIVGPYSTAGVNPAHISGLAGKYRGGYGTPFDLAALVDTPLLDKENVRFVRLVDIVGDGNAKDSAGRPIYDPWPVTGSGGFDLDAIGVIHQNDGGFSIVRSGIVGGEFQIEWESNPGTSYRIETSTTLAAADWEMVREVTGNPASGRTAIGLPMGGDLRRFWRVVRPE